MIENLICAKPIELPKPYPKKRAHQGARAMTITAGFKFKDGVLLCADTEQTQGDLKFSGSKLIFEDLRPASSIAFAISGDVSYATMAAQEIIAELRQSKVSTHSAIESIIKARILGIYADHLYPHPRAAYSDAPAFDLLIAVWAEGFVRLLSARATAVTEILDYDCMGIGQTLAKYLIKPVYHGRDLKQRDVEMIAVRMLVHVKENVAGCGQQSEFLVLATNGSIKKLFGLVAQHRLVDALDGLLPLVFFCAGDLDAPDVDVSSAVDFMKSALLLEREKSRAAKQQAKISSP
jgi:20S proteasome alpha/beta subunit